MNRAPQFNGASGAGQAQRAQR